MSNSKVFRTVAGLGVLVMTMGAVASAQNVVPDLRSLDELNLWASIAFAFAGLELSSAMGGEVRNPRRTLRPSSCRSLSTAPDRQSGRSMTRATPVP